MFAVMKKEFKSYFLSPVGYIFIGIFLFIFSIFFKDLFTYGMTNFEYLFGNGATILTFLVPVLTMRMFSEERKSGTEQLLMTSPRSMLSIVLGKFLAAACIILITELLTLGYYAILAYFGKPSLVIALSTLLGFFLLSMAYISFGMFASSITENQIVAYVITVVVFLAMWFLLGTTSTAADIFALIYVFDAFPSGLIPVAGIITFLSFTILCIILTVVMLQRRKSIR